MEDNRNKPMKVEITFGKESIDAIKTKFEIENEDDLLDAILEMISTYLEMD